MFNKVYSSSGFNYQFHLIVIINRLVEEIRLDEAAGNVARINRCVIVNQVTRFFLLRAETVLILTSCIM